MLPQAQTLDFEVLRPLHLPLFPEAQLTAWLRSLIGAQGAVGFEGLWLECARGGLRDLPRGAVLRCALWHLPPWQPLAEIALRQFQALPGSAQHLQGMLTQQVRLLSRSPRLSAPLTPQSLAEEVQHWRAQGDLRMVLESPMRLSRSEAGGRRVDNSDARFVRDERDLSGPLLASRIMRSLAELQKICGQAAIWAQALPLEISAKELFWVQAAYGAQAKPLGGLCGELILRSNSECSDAFWQALVLGQYLGIGQKRAFGYGRYRLESLSGGYTRAPLLAASSVLQACADPQLLLRAYDHVAANTEYAAADTADDTLESTDQRQAWRTERLRVIGKNLAAGEVSAAPLRPFDIPKADGSARTLMIAPFWDRVSQRALLEVLEPMFTPLLTSAAYGFIRGRSREQARDALLRLYSQGFAWLVESDVDAFFDSVDFWRVAVRLRALLGVDIAVEQILQFVAAPALNAQGNATARARGLPQGSPLSPMLSNVLLADFDADVLAAGFQLVRYADDFVIACKSAAQAQSALEIAAHSLAEKGLTLNPKKTRVLRFDQGFHFLGYAFAGGVAVDSKHGTQFIGDVERLAALDIAPEVHESWVHESWPPNTALPDADSFGTLLVLSGAGAIVGVQDAALQLRFADGRQHQEALSSLGAVLLIGRHSITTPALHALLKADVPTYFADARGRYLGSTQSAASGQQIALWIAQKQAFTRPEFALHCAQAVVNARIRHQRELLRQRGCAGVDELARASVRVQATQNLAELNGVEGAAAAVFFRGLQTLVPREFGFAGRARRPPPDPFNALLSLGYTQLYAHVDLVLRSLGLLTSLGFYHQGRGSHAALASDFMEPFRHLVERTALTLLRRGQLKVEEFQQAGGNASLYPSAKRLYLTALEQRFSETIKALESDVALNLHQHVKVQAQSLIAAMQGKGAFSATLLR